MQGIFLATAGLHALDDLVALLPQAVHVNHLFRRVLQVAVHDYHTVSGGLGQPRKNGGLLAEVPGEAHTPYLRMTEGLPLHGAPSAVLRAVIHKNELMGNGCLGQNLGDGVRCPGNGALLIKGGKYHGQQTLF